MPKLGELIEVWGGGNVEPKQRMYFICETDQCVIIADNEGEIENLKDGHRFFSYPFENWREIPKPKRVHWEREDYPKVPMYYRHKESGEDYSAVILTNEYIFLSNGLKFTYKQFSGYFDLLNEDGSLTELYKEVSE